MRNTIRKIRSYRKVSTFLTVFFVVIVLTIVVFVVKAANGQTDVWANTSTATAWFTTTNWDTANVPGTTGHDLDTAQFANAGSATSSGINMTTAGGNLQIGAIEVTSARTRALAIGTSTNNTGVLTLVGNTVNSV